MKRIAAIGAAGLLAGLLLWSFRPSPKPAAVLPQIEIRGAARAQQAPAQDPQAAVFLQDLKSKKEKIPAPPPVRYHDGTRVREVYWASDEAQVTLKPGAKAATAAAGAEIIKARDAEVLLRKSFSDRAAFTAWAGEMQRREGVNRVQPVFYATAQGLAERLEDQRRVLFPLVALTTPRGVAGEVLASRYGARVIEKVGYLPNTYILETQGPFEALDLAAVLREREGVSLAIPQFGRRPYKLGHRLFAPNDPLYAPQQWHLRNTGQFGGTAGQDVNVEPAWDVTRGAGVVICIIDDSVQYTHPDLADNYLAALGLDINGGDTDPAPGAVDDNHGTSVAGVAAARGNNGLGVSGAAPDASIAAIRLISTAILPDFQIAQAMTHENANVHIKSNSWAFSINGKVDDVEDHVLDLAAIVDGAVNGRGGKGVIYLWAAGNSADILDNCNYDAYCTRRQVIAVGAVGHTGVKSSYSEPGAALLVCAPSGNKGSSEPGFIGIATTDRVGSQGYNAVSSALGGDYTVANNDTGFGGTSSATPLVAGVVGLLLAANPDLTWRDVQHVLVRTARKNDLASPTWFTNNGGLGRQVSPFYGHGVVDAGAGVLLARRTGLVPPEQVLTVSSGALGMNIPDSPSAGEYGAPVANSIGVVGNLKIDNIEIEFSATHPYRGDLRVRLTSPAGSVITLADRRGADNLDNYSAWQFKSTLNWGEMSAGTWTLSVDDGDPVTTGTFDSWALRIYGVPLDTTVPTAGTVNDGPGADAAVLIPTASVTANWAGFADAESGALGYEVQLERVSDNAVLRAYQGVGNVTTATLTGLSLVPGTAYRVRVRANNFEGGTVAAVSNGFTCAMPASSISATPAIGNTGNIALSWTASADLLSISGYTWTVERRLNAGAFATVATGLATIGHNDSGLPEGLYTYRVFAVDAAGRAGALSGTSSATVDLTAPDTTITQAPPNPSGLTTETFLFTSSELGSTFEYSLDGGAFVAAGAGSQVLAGLTLGAHTFAVRAIDPAGNVDASPATHAWTILLNPVDTAGPWMNNLDLPWAVTNWTISAANLLVGWAVDGTPASVPGGAARTGPASLNYNNGGTYDNGAANSGTATSPAVSIVGMSSATFRFMCNYQVGDPVDVRRVEVLSAQPPITLNLTSGLCGTSGVWHEHAIALNPVTMPSVTLRFSFIADSLNNAYAGWFIDDVSISDLQVNALAQFESGASVALPVGATSSTGMIEFRSQIAAGVANPVRLEVEIVPVASSFTGTPTATSTAVGAGTVLGFAIAAPDGAYKWRARTVNATTSVASMWVDYGTNGGSATDFAVAVPVAGGGGGGGGCGALGIEAFLIPLLALGIRRRRKA